MYTQSPPLHPATLVGLFREDRAMRLTPVEIAVCLQVWNTAEITRYARPGVDGKIGWHEVSPLRAFAAFNFATQSEFYVK